MVKKMTPGRADIELFVECLFNQYSHILLKEEHITRTDKLKGYREYENGDEVKRELADMLERFVTKYESNDYVYDVRFHASNKEGLSNYIDVTFNVPFGAKEWLKHMSIRASDHYQRKSKKKVDEYIDLNGKSVADIEKDLDRIINKRIRRLEREFNVPKAQNESLRKGNAIMKLRINENNFETIDYSKSTMTVEEFMNKLEDIFYSQFPNCYFKIELVNNIRSDNIWIEMFSYGKFFNGADDINSVLNAHITIDLFSRYDNNSELTHNNYVITPSGSINLPAEYSFQYDMIIGSGRTTRGNTEKLLNKFTQFCKNCKTAYKKQYGRK